MKILALGDVVGTRAVEYLKERLWNFRRENKIDFVIANGENATEIRGLCARDAKELSDAGVDVITLGNHAFGMKDLHPMLELGEQVIRPANYPSEAPGMGYTISEACGWRLLCMNVNGRVFMEPFASPFDTVDAILRREEGKYDVSILDVHAEATSEKIALGRYLDGRVNVIFGTHTHVVTADEEIFPNGTAYQTDIGMCGPTDGVIGSKAETVIARFRTMMPAPPAVAEGKIEAHGTVFELDPPKVKSIRRVKF